MLGFSSLFYILLGAFVLVVLFQECGSTGATTTKGSVVALVPQNLDEYNKMNKKKSPPRGTIARLRNAALLNLQQKNYENASKYYTAILQLVEGLGDDYSTDMRRRCGLTLAECDLKCYRYHSAIARCSEIISEFGNYICTGDHKTNASSINAAMVQKTLGTAHFRRATALKLLKKSKWSQVDLSRAVKYQPNNSKIKSLLLKTRKSSTTQETVNKMEDFIDNCLCNNPRVFLTENSINALSKVSASTSSFLSSGAGATGLLGKNLFGDLVESDGTAKALAMMTGMSERSVKMLLRAVKIGSVVFSSISRLYGMFSRNKEALIIFCTLAWLFTVWLKF